MILLILKRKLQKSAKMVVMGTGVIHLEVFIQHAVRESVNKSAASAASTDYVKFQAGIKSAASAASLRGGRASGRLDHVVFFAIFGRASGQKIVKISDSVTS